MNEREKIISAIEKAKKQSEEYAQDRIIVPFKEADMIIALLKEQKAVEPKLVDVNTWMCGKCGALLGWEEFSQFGLELIKYKYCPECGRHVKWE